jgi:hypothetical protein
VPQAKKNPASLSGAGPVRQLVGGGRPWSSEPGTILAEPQTALQPLMCGAALGPMRSARAAPPSFPVTSRGRINYNARPMKGKALHPVHGDIEIARWRVSVWPQFELNHDQLSAAQLRAMCADLSGRPDINSIGIWQHREDLGPGSIRLVRTWARVEGSWVKDPPERPGDGDLFEAMEWKNYQSERRARALKLLVWFCAAIWFLATFVAAFEQFKTAVH